MKTIESQKQAANEYNDLVTARLACQLGKALSSETLKKISQGNNPELLSTNKRIDGLLDTIESLRKTISGLQGEITKKNNEIIILRKDNKNLNDSLISLL